MLDIKGLDLGAILVLITDCTGILYISSPYYPVSLENKSRSVLTYVVGAGPRWTTKYRLLHASPTGICFFDEHLALHSIKDTYICDLVDLNQITNLFKVIYILGIISLYGMEI